MTTPGKPGPRARLVLAAVFGAGVAAVVVAIGAALFVWSGIYDIGATRQHLQPVYTLLKVTGVQSIRRHAADIAEPPLGDAAQVDRGAQCYREHCLVCHGGPGVAQGGMGLSMQPLPGPLVDAAHHFRARELYWILRHGIKMSGMPAWQYRISDSQTWATVAFLQRMPMLTAQQFREAMAAPTGRDGSCRTAEVATTEAPDAARGKVALTQFACNACHLIPGVTGAQIHVGPSLAGMASRATIAGHLANTPAQVAAWIVDPQRFDAGTAMPRLGVGERDARDIAAYLATLH